MEHKNKIGLFGIGLDTIHKLAELFNLDFTKIC